MGFFMRYCPACDGSGEGRGDGSQCAVCLGKGEVSRWVKILCFFGGHTILADLPNDNYLFGKCVDCERSLIQRGWYV
jgi:hypothetical protein